MSLIKSIKRSRLFNGFINIAFNHYDEKRIAQVGPDAAAAEWIVKNEGWVKGNKEKASWIKDFNSISQCYGPGFKLAYIKADNIDITSVGCRHIEGLKYLQFIDMRDCFNIDDSGFQIISKNSWNTLQYLDVAGTSISLRGLDLVTEFKNLKILKYDHKLSEHIERHNEFQKKLKEKNNSIALEIIKS